MIFVNSMSDLFHKDVPDDFIAKVFETMLNADHHIYQVLTKRPERMKVWVKSYFGTEIPPEHIWLGTSVENQDYLKRADDLLDTQARVRFLSIEPLLSHVKLSNQHLRGIHWIIVGGESGPGSRPINPAWVRSIREQCIAQNVPFFFKQWGAYDSRGQLVGKKAAGRVIDGRTWDEMPDVAAWKKQTEELLLI